MLSAAVNTIELCPVCVQNNMKWHFYASCADVVFQEAESHFQIIT
jgi:hypothetical protein